MAVDIIGPMIIHSLCCYPQKTVSRLKINLCSIGEPVEQNTWSGTPFNLYSELIRQGHSVYPFDSGKVSNKYVRKIIKKLHKIYYSTPLGLSRGCFQRYLNAYRVKQETSKSISNISLHTGTLDLPFFRLPKNQKHYLFCDTTWNLWSACATGIGGYSQKLIHNAEKLERKAYHQLEHIFPISDYVKKNLIEHYLVSSNKITVVGTGLGAIKPFFGPKTYTNGKIIFIAKTRFEDKGGNLVIEAFRLARKKNTNLKLSIIGKKEYLKKIREPHVKTFGHLPICDLQKKFNESSILIMPAANEPWGLVYLEALACKMPIIGLNKNSFPEISGYGKFGFGLNDQDPQKLADLLIDAFKKPQELMEMGISAQEYCLAKYSWYKTVLKITKVISSGLSLNNSQS